MSQNSVSFYWFFFADLRKNKGFKLADSPFFCLSQQKKINRSKRTAKKSRFFGTVNRLIVESYLFNTVLLQKI